MIQALLLSWIIAVVLHATMESEFKMMLRDKSGQERTAGKKLFWWSGVSAGFLLPHGKRRESSPQIFNQAL